MKLYQLTFIILFTLISISAQASPQFLVDSDWLSEHIEDENLVVLEVRYHPHRYHTIGHIPGAIQVQRFKDLADNQSLTVTRFPSKAQFQETLRSWGINNNSTLVIYDDTRTVVASRLYVLLKIYGFNMKQVKILNGGTIAWTGFEEITKDVPSVKTGKVTLKDANHSLFVEFPEIYDKVLSKRDPKIVLIDARPHDRYVGKKSLHPHAVRAGHIPGAINIVSMDGTDGQSQTWLDDKTIAALYKQVPKGKTVYVYCDDGFRMSIAFLQLTFLGYKDVRMYNGGWSQWGNWQDIPVVKGAKPFDDTFDL
jgi:thiosulfate/3-mercaptopyruvate sulfurtransferase